MANSAPNSVVIDKNNSDFADLDFNALRSSSIQYLSGLTGKIWTDYNVHDPGITILEILIYALLDLSYRTRLPAKDLFTKNPNETVENNFFTPAQILGCNPVTTADLRKMIVDVNGVKNAWVETADDIELKDYCTPQPYTGKEDVNSQPLPAQQDCVSFINGLYHIKLQLDGLSARPVQVVLDDVRTLLLSHRNFCEDFVDIAVLCELPIGVCADIALIPGAIADDVCKNIVIALTEFFSPAPKFYSLPQLLDKGKNMEEIFAGRPFNLKNSNGFVDTEEFESIQQITEIHLSDVYKIILNVDGVETVRKLKLKSGEGKFVESWKFKLPPGYLPVFSTDNSSIQFSMNGISLLVDFTKLSISALALGINTTKLLKSPDDMDIPVPQGHYHTDLAAYYSIQNEFPLAYGIGPHGLDTTATLQRQAQALQLKGYLLFFDQLLANYLSQLSNMRSLFSLTTPSADAAHSYFTNNLTNVPDLQSLLFNVADDKGQSAAGANGKVLGHPVRRADFEKLIQQASFSSKELKQLQQAFSFSSRHEYQVTTTALQNSFKNTDSYTISSKMQTADGFFFYSVFSIADIAFVSELYTDIKQDAVVLSAFKLLPGMGMISSNYNLFNANKGTISFNILLNLPTYPQYLAQIAEDRQQYLVRRDDFLNHLLSRFSEQFSDFAILSFSSEGKNLQSKSIQYKERFLTNYPSLSHDRGKAYNYRSADAGNTSGFEERFKAYTGIDNENCSSLCNFEIAKYEDTYSIHLRLAGIDLLTNDDVWEGKNAAEDALEAIFSASGNAANYDIDRIEHEDKYRVWVGFSNGKKAYYPHLLAKDDAGDLSAALKKAFANVVTDQDISVTKSEFKLVLKNSTGETIRISQNAGNTEADVFATAIASVRVPNDPTTWQIVAADSKPPGKFCSNDKKRPENLVDTEAFKIDINNTIVGKPDKFNYELLDRWDHKFKFASLGHFDNEKQARADAYRLLMLMTDKRNYSITPDKRKKIVILNNGQPVAEYRGPVENNNYTAFVDQVHGFVSKHHYRLSAEPFPCRWKYGLDLGFEKGVNLHFESVDEFTNALDAREAATVFRNTLQQISLEVVDGKYSLLQPGRPGPVLICTLAGPAIEVLNEETKLEKARQLLRLQQKIAEHRSNPEASPIEEGVQIDALSNTGAYVYRLVDKGNLQAKHVASGQNGNEDGIINDLYARAQAGYDVLEICLGGDITETVKDKQGTVSGHRYMIACRRDLGSLKDKTVLFKSSDVYPSSQEAEGAFYNNYLQVLSKATDAANYGPGKYISLDASGHVKPNTDKKTTVVFVPAETQAVLQAAGENIIQSLAYAALCYPVKLLLKCSDEYKKYYPEKAGECIEPIDAGAFPGQSVYSFTIYNKTSSATDWVSVQTYDSAQQAMQAYLFFKLLLQYKGNYKLASNDNGGLMVYIREVLAESRSRFVSEDEAWAEKGVEKFICIAQSDKAFHSALRVERCDYGFDIACDGINGIHPCKYESPTHRDEALNKLFAAHKAFDTSKLFRLVGEDNSRLLYGIDGKRLALVPGSIAAGDPAASYQQIIEILAAAGNDKNYILKDDRIYLTLNDSTLATAVEGVSQAAWKKQLLTLAYYLPIEKANGKYCVEIRLPDFNNPDNGKRPVPGCGCPPQTLAGELCYVAWKSSCCYGTSADAFQAWANMLVVLDKFENYRPYFDCNCYSYGISLVTETDIVAASPQHYSSPEMLCDAIKRSKKLINCEGLFAIEHILLRPRTVNSCACAYAKPGNFAKQTNCEQLRWTEERFSNGEENPYNICFTPGEDPFSFIATVVLPAWPARFRKKENRDLLETILYREAPAHVLLRILWLRPQDACKFETLFKKWKNVMLDTDIMVIEKAACDLMEFLVNTPLKCLSDCVDCLPCKDVNVDTSCSDEIATKKVDSTNGLNTINQLFGFSEISCEATPDSLQEQKAKAATATPEPQLPKLSRKEAQFINLRRSAYNRNIESLGRETGNSQVIKDAIGLISGARPNLLSTSTSLLEQKDPAQEINGIVTTLMDSENEAGNLQLTNEQKALLIKNLVWFYLDKCLIENKSIEDVRRIDAALDKLTVHNFDMDALYAEWKPEDVKVYVGAAPIATVEEMLKKSKT